VLARSLRRLPVTYWFIINEISAVICCEDPSSGIRHSAERKREKRQGKEEKGWWSRMWDTKMNRMSLMRKRNREKVELTQQMILHQSKKDKNKATGTSRRTKPS